MNDIYIRQVEAVLALLKARDALDEAQENVPDYTGQYSREHYYADEQEAYDAAVIEYGKAHEMTSDEVEVNEINKSPGRPT